MFYSCIQASEQLPNGVPNYTVHVQGKDDLIDPRLVTTSTGLTDKDAIAFAREKETWLRKHLDARGADVVVQQGAQIPIGGHNHLVKPCTGRKVIFSDGIVEVPGRADRIGARLAGHLKEIARVRFTESSDHYARKLGKPYSQIALRDTRSRWGSCSSDGRLMYSWRLILAPPDVLDYVVAHEVAHLDQMNHSSAFWARVEEIYGDYQKPRQWLRARGGELHRFRFGR